MALMDRIPSRKSYNFLPWFLAAACMLLTAPQLFGQLEAGAISGTVKDASGAVIAGATVTAKNLATGAERNTKTGSIGQYRIPALTPGNYQVTIGIEKFQTYRTTTEVTVGSVATVDGQLTVGQSSAVIEVVGGAATQVNTETQEQQQLINTQQMAQLPSLNRNPYDFVAISGNVSNGDSTSNGGQSSLTGGGQELSGRGVGYNLNGQRQSGTEILLDGVENISIYQDFVGEDVPVDGVQEFGIVTNNFSAEYGRASGGVVNVTTKPGTNDFHGSAWEFNRLGAYTANTYANAVADVPKGQYTRNQFGFSAGGPIIKNKLFVSETTEWTRVRSAAIETEEVLDPGFIFGNSTYGWPGLPANAQAYFKAFGTGASPASGKVTDVQQLAAASSPIIVNPVNGITAANPLLPVFDVVNFAVPFNDGGGLPQNTYALVGRLDYAPSDKTQMFFRAARERIDAFPGTNFPYSAYPQYDLGYLNQNQSYLLSATHSFDSYLLNNTKLSFTRFNDEYSFNSAYQSVPDLMFYPGVDPATGNALSLPGLANENTPGLGGLPAGGPQNTIQLEHDLSWTKGKHNMRFGGQYTYIQLNYAYGAYAQAVEQLGGDPQDSMDDLVNFAGNPGGSQLGGNSGFAGRVHPSPGGFSCPVDVNGNPVSPCPANSVVTPPLSAPSYARSYRYNDWALYAMDSFRFTPRLMLNYGLRYEHYGVQHNNQQNLDSNFYFGSGSGLYEQVRSGQVDLTQQSPTGQFWAPSWGTAAPRVGFAYDIFGDGKSSVRGGFGISYERNFGNITYNASFNPPASAVIQSSCPARSASCTTLVTNASLGPLGAPGPSSNLPPVELRFLDPNIRVAQTQFWSLSLQREVAKNTIVDLGYSGAHGVHLYDLNNVNLQGAGQEYLGDPAVDSTDVNPGSMTCNPGNVSPTGVCLTRPNSQYTSNNMRGSAGSSSYNSFNFKFQTQNLHHTGLSLVANYTWSHSLDDISSTFSDSLQGGSGNGYGTLGYTLLTDPKLDWGNSDFDVRNRLIVSPIWETPWFKSGKGLGEALGGWSLVGVFTARTGIPFTAYNLENDFNFYTFPRLTPATPITDYHVSSNPASIGTNLFSLMTLPLPSPASSAPLNPTLGISDFGPFPAGMTARNAFRGPGAWNLDAAVSKTFKLTERFGLTFRAEGFNVFNHHNMYTDTFLVGYTGPTTTPLVVPGLKGGLGSLAEGGNNDERRFGQFSLRLSF
jgi:Carboxypeptidase regulatory-like domain